MRPKSKRMVLVVVAMCAAGCARSDYRNMRTTRPGGPPAQDKSLRNVEDEKPPKILPETHFAAGMLFERQGQVDKAIVQYRKAAALNHHYLAAFHRLGLALSALGQHDEAVAALRRAAELRPDNAVVRNNLGFEYLLTDQLDDAERELRRAIALQPTFARAHINLGLILAKTERFDDALASFRQVLPETDAYYNLGLMFRGQQRYTDAAVAFEHTLSLDPEFNSARIQLAELNLRLPAERPKADAEPDLGQVIAQDVQPEIEPTVMAEVEPSAPTDEAPTTLDIFAMIDEILAKPPTNEPSVEPAQPSPPHIEAAPIEVPLEEREAALVEPTTVPEPAVAVVAGAQEPELLPVLAVAIEEEGVEDCDRTVARQTEPAVEIVAEPSAVLEPPAAVEPAEPAVAADDEPMMPDVLVHPTTEPLPSAEVLALEPDADEIVSVFASAAITEVRSIRESWMMLDELEAKIALLQEELRAPTLAYVPVQYPSLKEEAWPTMTLDGPPAVEAGPSDEHAHDETPVVHTDDDEAEDVDSEDPTASAEPMEALDAPTDPASLPPTEDFEWTVAFEDLEALLSVVINETHCWEQLDRETEDALALMPSEPCLDDPAASGVSETPELSTQPEQSFEEFVEEDAQAQAQAVDDGSN